MIVLSSAETTNLLPMSTAIELVADAMISTSRSENTLPLRHAMDVGGGNKLGIMPGAMQDPACFGTKLISLYPNNPAKGHSSHLGLMVLFEQEFGQPVAVMNAGTITAVRTAAASAVATRALARENAQVLTVVGTGEQAANHIEAIRIMRDIREVRIVGRSPERAAKFISAISPHHKDVEFIAVDTVEEAAKGADIICTVTSAHDVVLKGDWVEDGCHVNAVGASVPTMQEIDEALVVKSSLFVDYRASAFAQAADIIGAIENGVITQDHVLGEIGEVLAGTVPGRKGGEITLYRSLGIAAQDLICAHHVMTQAQAREIGADVSIT